MPNKPTLVLDFDGVLHSYTSGWQRADIVSDPPVPGAGEFLTAALAKFEVSVVSSRSHEAGGRHAMAAWIVKHFGGEEIADQCHLGAIYVQMPEGRIDFPNHKPPAFVTIDDRAIQFDGKWPDVDQLLAFTPWNKRPAKPKEPVFADGDPVEIQFDDVYLMGMVISGFRKRNGLRHYVIEDGFGMMHLCKENQIRHI